MIKEHKKQIGVEVPESMKKTLEEMANRQERTLAAEVRVALKKYVEESK